MCSLNLDSPHPFISPPGKVLLNLTNPTQIKISLLAPLSFQIHSPPTEV